MTTVTLIKKYSVFFRLHLFGYTITLILSGVGLAKPDISIPHLVGWVFVAIFYHIFAYVSNDLIDLEIDRTAKARQESHLVSGTASIFRNWLLVVSMVVGALILVWLLEKSLSSLGILVTSFLSMVAYNWKGKRSGFPPVTDFLQGVAWGTLLLLGYGFGGVDRFLWILFLFLYQIVYIMLINGFHASLRDIKNDQQRGARTTAMYLGAEIDAGDCLVISRTLKKYAFMLNLILMGLMTAISFVAVKTHPIFPFVISGFIAGLLVVVSWSLAHQGWKMLKKKPNVDSNKFFYLYLIGSCHMTVLLLLPFVFIFPLLPPNIQISIILLFVGSLVLGNLAGAGFQLYLP